MTRDLGSTRPASPAVPAHGSTQPTRPRRAGRRLAMSTLALFTVLATGFGYGASHLVRPARIAEAAVPSLHRLGTADPPESLAVAEFKNYALNALLIPLLDDGAPPRWLDPFTTTVLSMAIDCAGAGVSIDGHPLIPSTPVPARAFTLRWNMDHCVILNGRTSLTGVVELLVFHDGDRYTASVHPIGLRVLSDLGDEAMSEPFAATTPLTPTIPL